MKLRPLPSHFTAFFAWLALGLLLGGCASGPVVYDIRGDADPVVNRDVTGRPLSVVVRLYQLSEPDEFNKLTFDTLSSGRPEADLLGDQLIAKSEVVLVPGQTQVATDKMDPKARYLGVVGFFRTPDTHYWRYLIKADQIRDKGLTFKAQDCYLTLLNQKPQPIPGQTLDAKPVCNMLTTPEPPSTRAAENQPAPTKSKGKSKPAQASSGKTYPTTTKPTDPVFVDQVIDRVTDRAASKAVEYALDRVLPPTATVPAGAYKP